MGALKYDIASDQIEAAFGESLGSPITISPSTPPVVYGFQGMQLDAESGLYTTPSGRMYQPSIGRWLQPDPKGFGGHDANLYRFVANNPLIYVDPMGTDYTVPVNGGTLVYPGNPGQGVQGPANMVTNQTMQGVDAPVQSGVVSLGPLGTVGLIVSYIPAIGPAVGTAIIVFDGTFGPDPTALPGQFMNTVNTMGQTVFPNDPVFRPSPTSSSCPK